ncbi:aromatic acid exporter family protein [Bacillus sp. ISL-7]|uniref:aromatic acid exporter family protein n=1 Tax=Bacillus sp. ISL-7 TaxID=2819136 RepID=UPI001BEA1579|nr:aromatic acid exporter family protein [Bacillus sp. ISL-7]MBT2733205.1 FUSC family protein [Bacillus sp. ISL-7]
MEILHHNKFVGGRIIKTGIAVLLTSMLCYLLKWPEMFAVITAIVTIEPTSLDSIKKAFIRFPASAIGAAYSVLFTFFFGDRPFTYTLVALGTIFTCHKLRLHAGILVATLTGVAMISTVHHQFIESFFIRLGTTSIGLMVSSLVNLLVFRPDYSENIMNKTKQLFLEAGLYIEKRGLEIVYGHPLHKETKMKFQSFVKKLEAVDTLCENQKKECKIHHFSREEIRVFHYAHKKINLLHQMIHHLGNLNSLPPLKSHLDDDKKEMMISAFQLVKRILQGDHICRSNSNHRLIDALDRHLRHSQSEVSGEQNPQFPHFVSHETFIIFEILSIMDILEELKQLQKLELKHIRLGGQ